MLACPPAMRRRSLLTLGIACWALPAAAQDEEGRPPNQARRIGLARVASVSLRTVYAELADTLTAARVGTGLHDGNGIEVLVHFVRFTPRLPLEQMPIHAMRAALRPGPFDVVWHESASAIGPAQLATAFGDHAAEPPMRALAADLTAALAPYPTLALHSCACGWADATGGRYQGPLVIDSAAREAMFVIHGETWSD